MAASADASTLGRKDHCHVTIHQFCGQCRQPIDMTVGRACFDRVVATLDITSLFQPLEKGNEGRLAILESAYNEVTDHGYRRLRTRHHRPLAAFARAKNQAVCPERLTGWRKR
jgi:hypothetical protein